MANPKKPRAPLANPNPSRSKTASIQEFFFGDVEPRLGREADEKIIRKAAKEKTPSLTSRKHKESAIPVGTGFSSELIDLPSFLSAARQHSGNKAKLLEVVNKPPVRKKQRRGGGKPTKRAASLPLEAAIQYGLLDSTYAITALGVRLLELSPATRNDELAKHILLNLGGLRIIEGIRQMRADSDERVTGDTLALFLTSQGFNVSVHNTAINTLRMWLAEAGVFPKGRGKHDWEFSESRLEELLGLSADQIVALAGLEPHQAAFVEAICAIGLKDKYDASEVRALAKTRKPQVRFSHGSLPNDVLRPLQEAGLISFETRGTKGGKASTFTVTRSFNVNVLQQFVENSIQDLDSTISGYFKKQPKDIFKELKSTNTAVKGRALEALAIRVMRLLGLRFLSWNNRAKDTGWSEVDAVFAGVFGAAPTRWQIQCKNTPSTTVTLEDIAKEVGLVPITRATHILFLANNDFTSEAVKFADEIMRNSALTLFLLGKKEFDELKDKDSFGRILTDQAARAVRMHGGTIFAWR